MSQRNIIIVVAVVVVLALIGYSMGWFGGGDTGEAPAEQTGEQQGG